MEANRFRESKVVSTVALTEVVLDTSFAIKMTSEPMASFDRIGVLGKTSFIVLEDVLRELDNITRRNGLRARQAKAALQYVNQLKTVEVKGRGSCDEKILRYAVEKHVPVATLDGELRRKLRKAGIIVITMRGREVYVEGV